MKKIVFLLLFLTLGSLLSAAVYEIRIENSSKTGWVKAGEAANVKAAVYLDGKPIPAGYTLRVDLWKDGGPYKIINVPAEKGYTVSLSLDKPGWAYAGFLLRDPKNKNGRVILKNKKSSVGTGIVLDPYKLQPARTEPKDFDAFWNANKAELAKTPLKVLEKNKVSISPQMDKRFDCFDMKIACAGPKPVSGYLTIPVNKNRKYPVILSVDGAGVRSSGKSTMQNAIYFSVNAHGIINGQPKSFYADLAKGSLKGYPAFGNTSRDTIYFKYMFLRVLRALEYLKSLPEWNGKDVIVRGSSQGGAQTLFAAAMDKDVTLAITYVPAMCDFGGTLSVPRRHSGWPRPYTSAKKDMVKRTAWDYYDCVNFARRITCPIYVSTGFSDMTCVPTSVFCMFNQIRSEKKFMETHRDMGHAGINNAGNAAFVKACRQASGKR